MLSTMSSKASLSGWSPYVKVYDPLKAGSIDGTDLDPHDHAVVRAMSAKYKPPDERTVTSDPSLTLFVGRLNFRTSERQLTEEFSKYGHVKSCRVVRDIVTGISRGYGFVEFKRQADAQNAWRLAHATVFQERQILVEWEFARTLPGWIPRRLGGGLGGKKESGQLRFGGRDRPFKRPYLLPPEQQEESQAFEDDNASSFKPTKRLQNDQSGREETGRSTKFNSSRDEWPNKYGQFNREDEMKYGRGRDNKFAHHSYNGDRGRYKSRTEEQSYYEEDRRDYHRYKEEKFEDQSYYGENNRKSRRYPPDDNYTDWSYHEEGREKYQRHYEEQYSEQGYSAGSSKKYRHDKYVGEKRYGKDSYSFSDRYDRKRQEKERREDYEETRNRSKRDYSSSSYHSETKGVKKLDKRRNEERSSDRNYHDSLSWDANQSEPEASVDYDAVNRLEKYGSNSKRSRSSSGSSDSQISSSKKKPKKSKHKKKKHNSDSEDSNDLEQNRDLKKHKKSKKSKKTKKSKKRRSSDRDSD
ncbi:U11/U12 small nuclear ribonucleoprotein 35 kDa protein-like [Thrips palmi]|uniref:U11/U12 small nuclear ribonucleoprotein 35 kDa protein n=1 Tax=Thrips palmi TaxID=161013 RepID=A0A6P8Z6F6_THRPL|nr:U11/U12 small nuclear ribonucleoprotein 35 kDa protein-like [Thrips palmi]